MRRRSYGAVTYALDTASRTPCSCTTVNIPSVSSLRRGCDVTFQDGGWGGKHLSVSDGTFIVIVESVAIQ